MQVATNLEILDTFGLDDLPMLDVAVLGALELFQHQPLQRIDVSAYRHPLVVGSGCAEATGRILFETVDALFASESNFEEKLCNIPSIDGVVLISASGSKHAPRIARRARELGKHITLITNSQDSPASRELDTENDDKELVFPKNREPYTYNVSTYMGMILAATGEDPAAIHRFIRERISKLGFPEFSRYDKYYLIVPARFSNIVRMLQNKFSELFGRNIARDVETSEYVRHATTVAPSDELFISFGEENTTWGKPESRLFVPLPDNTGYGAMLAVGNYTVAQIQAAYPNYFKDNIVRWSVEVSQLFHETITPIVEK
jgi:hypothetical protein